MFCGKGRDCSGPANLRAAGDGDHDGRLLLALLWRLDGEAASTPNNREDVEEVDGKHRIEKYLKVALRNGVSLQPAIYNYEVFDFDGEARCFTGSGLASSALLLSHLHVGQCLKLAGSNFDGGGGLLHERLRLGVTLPG